ncbi:MAG: protein kinase [Myxococcales bacterium]|nr:protein kinase [Myxococcales bacterium]
MMAHPSLEDIVAGLAAAHVTSCPSCRQLAHLAGMELPPSPPEDDLDRLAVVDDAVYTDWEPLAAEGGMGQIFRVRDRRLGRFVAIKQLKPGLPEHERSILVRRFEREARLTARLQHPAIVGVHEAGRFANGEPFYAMPLLRGAPLSAEIDRRKTVAERLALLANLTTVAEAIAYAHEQGIVHRDIKPDNILVGQFGETVVIDWGLAKDVSEQGGEPESAYRAAPTDGLTQFGVGTANYMPPEQAKGDEPDPSFDVYALGATLYHLLAGQPPHSDANDSSEIRRRLIYGTAPRPLADVAPEVPPELADIVAKAMAPARADRFDSARELARELRRYQTGQLLASRRYTLGELLRHWMRKHRTALRISAVAGAVVLALAVFAFVRIRRERDRATESQAQAERELRRAQGIVASRSAADPVKRMDALLLGIQAVAPDLATSPTPEAVQGLVDALTAGPPLVPLRHEGVIKYFTSVGDTLIGVDDARELVLWSARSGKPLGSHPSALPQPERPRASPDGKRVVVCGFDPIGEVFELATGAHVTFEAKADFAGCAFLPDGRVITAADDVALRDPATGAVVKRFSLPARASSLALGPDGRVAVTTIDGTLWLWSGGEPTAIATKLPLGGTSAFDRTGTILYSNGHDQIVRAFDLANPSAPPRVVFENTTAQLAALVVDPATDRAAVGMWDHDGARHSRVFGAPANLDGNIQAWTGTWGVFDRLGPLAITDVERGGIVLPLTAHAGETHVVEVVGDRIASASRDGAAFLWDAASGAETGMLLGHTGEIVAALARGDLLLTASHDGTARVWDSSGAPIAVVPGPRELTAAVWLDDARFVVGDLGGHVRTIEARTGKILSDVDAGAPVSALAAGHGRLAIGTLGGALIVGDQRSDGRAVTALAFSADGATLYSAHVDGIDRAWDPRTMQRTAESAPGEPVDTPADTEGDVALIPNGDTLLGVRPAGTTRTLDARTLAVRSTREGRLVADGVRALQDGTVVFGERRVAAHRGAITAAARDQGLVATASVDGTVWLWSATGDARFAIAGPGLGAPTSLAFTHAALAIGYASGAVRLVPTTPAAALAQACRIAKRFDRGSDVAPHCN